MNFVDIGSLELIVAAIVVTVATIALLAVRYELARIALAAMLGVAVLVGAAAMAEPETRTVVAVQYETKPVQMDDESMWLVVFQDGWDDLSLYWDESVPKHPLEITLWGDECVNAEEISFFSALAHAIAR